MWHVLLLSDSEFLGHPECDHQDTSVLLPAETHWAVPLVRWELVFLQYLLRPRTCYFQGQNLASFES